MTALRQWRTKRDKASLFERLQQERSGMVSDRKSLTASIKNNLQHIFNARPGECHGSKALGIMNLHDALLSSEEIQTALCQALKTCIAHYEPRMQSVEVSVRHDQHTAFHCFVIVAYLDQIAGQEKIEFDVYLTNNALNIM